MKRLVKVRANGKCLFAMWSSAAGVTTDYMPKKDMARWLKRSYPAIDRDVVKAALKSAVDASTVGP